MTTTSTVETRGGEVTATLTHEDGMPHVAFAGASGLHRIAVPDHFGGAARALGHAEGFLSDKFYGLTTEEAKALAATLVAGVMGAPSGAEVERVAPAAKAPAVRFDFDQTESTGYVRVWAHVGDKVYKVATAGRNRIAKHWSDTSSDDTPRTWSYVIRSLPKAVRVAAEAAKVGERAEAMARRWVQPRKAR